MTFPVRGNTCFWAQHTEYITLCLTDIHKGWSILKNAKKSPAPFMDRSHVPDTVYLQSSVVSFPE